MINEFECHQRSVAQWVVSLCYYCYFRHGKAVANYPQVFIPLCLLVTGLFGVGNLKYTPESNPFKLWIPQNSDFVQNNNWLWQKFPPDTRFHSVIITADNVLTPKVLKHVRSSIANSENPSQFLTSITIWSIFWSIENYRMTYYR